MREAWAQAGAAPGGPPAIYNIGFIVLMIAIFWLVLLRPEQKRRREHARLVANVKKNDQVVLSCGLHGRIVGVADRTVTVEIAPRVQAVFDRQAIQSVAALGAAADSKEKEKG